MQLKGEKKCRVQLLVLLMTFVIVLGGCSSKKNEEGSDVTSSPDATVTADDGQETEEPLVTEEPIETVPLDTVLLTVDKAEYTLQDFMYLVYYLEESYAYTASYYEQLFGIDFWNDILEEDSDETGRDSVREEAMSLAEIISVMAPVALSSDYALTEEDEELVQEIVTGVLAEMDDEYLERTGFTEDNLTKMVRKLMLAFNYYNEQVDNQKVDEDSIAEEIDYDEYKQTQLEYVFIETTYIDEEGESISYSAEEISDSIKKGKEILKLAQAGTSMEDAVIEIVGEEYSNIYSDTMAMYDEDMEDELSDAVATLKEGELYDGLIEVEDGYYIVRLVENNATEGYDEAVAEAIEEEKQTQYASIYYELAEKHEITFNEDAWELIQFGNYAYPPMEYADDEDSDEDYFEIGEDEDDTITSEDAEDDGSVG